MIEFTNVSMQFGVVKALDNITVSFPGDSITGLVGPNGAGKSTLFNVVCGFAEGAEGAVSVNGVRIDEYSVQERYREKIVRTFQAVRLMERESVFDNVLLGCEGLGQPGLLKQFMWYGSGSRARRRDLLKTAEMLEFLGIDRHSRQPVSELPYGLRRLVEIGRALVGSPRVLLLDEPMAGMDSDGRSDLVRILKDSQADQPKTLVIVEHDVDVVREISDHVVALDYGNLLAAGTPATVFNDPRVTQAFFGTDHDVEG